MESEADRVTVQTDCGPVLGQSVTSQVTGSKYLSFEGIPYARPPVGPLRFKPPEPVEPWTSVKDCRQEGEPCVQFHMWLRNMRGSEDCLFLNVYTPELPSTGMRLYPVMFFIHGGGFTTGSGGRDLSGPDFIVDEQTLLVTINYRLGVFGFLTVEEPGDAQGNMGLKDQVEALKWVKRNIAFFGGDPSRVTIVGESAGGASVHLHMMSPMSRGLFAGAISESGAVFNQWAFTNQGRQRAFRLGESLGCKTSDSKTLLKFLRSLPAEELVENANKAFSEEDKEYNCAVSPFAFVPTLERTDGSVAPFLAEDPRLLLREGRFFQGPFLAGVNSSEGILSLAAYIGKDEEAMIKSFNKRVSKLIPNKLNLNRGSPEEKRVSRSIYSYYLKNKPITKESVMDYLNLLSDIMFVYGFYEAIQLQSRFTSPYLYKFSYDGGANMFKKFILAEAYPGACHADELFYLFQTALSPPWKELPDDCPDVITRKRMVKMWTNFAKTGNPTPNSDNVLGVKWSPAKRGKITYLDIDKTLQNRSGWIYEDRMAFWDSLTERSKL